jgi:hypothetical protein
MQLDYPASPANISKIFTEGGITPSFRAKEILLKTQSRGRRGPGTARGP